MRLTRYNDSGKNPHPVDFVSFLLLSTRNSILIVLKLSLLFLQKPQFSMNESPQQKKTFHVAIKNKKSKFLDFKNCFCNFLSLKSFCIIQMFSSPIFSARFLFGFFNFYLNFLDVINLFSVFLLFTNKF